MVTITQLSQQFDLPTSTLRYYETLGLLTDVPRCNGRRVYAQRHINRLKTLCCFKQAGMTLEQLQTFFALADRPGGEPGIVALLAGQEAVLAAKQQALADAMTHLHRKLAFHTACAAAAAAHRPQPDWSHYRDLPQAEIEALLAAQGAKPVA
ncbi:MerR family transcriptional regulator [Lacticaseibacillus absianus]|uniref:MerR family transcriptional regulator n=1 Tax=Lacticaseibacillus absianus TaxID=2729623 RepID=UPI0015C9717B|nr:MerR family transcriptional regulator [Lacticaseibacillus absianus]